MDTTTARRSEDGGGNSRSSAGKEKISWPSTQAIGEKKSIGESSILIFTNMAWRSSPVSFTRCLIQSYSLINVTSNLRMFISKTKQELIIVLITQLDADSWDESIKPN
jgi:hypothetical protein